LGNVGEVSDIPALERAAADPEPLIAEHAAWAIEQIEIRNGITRRRTNQTPYNGSAGSPLHADHAHAQTARME
jgi:hypothetical protein